MSDESSYRLFHRIEYQRVYVLFAIVLVKVNSTLDSSHKKE